MRGFEASDAESGAFLVFAVRFPQVVAASSNGQDAVLSRLRWEFDSPRCYQEDRCVRMRILEVKCRVVQWQDASL